MGALPQTPTHADLANYTGPKSKHLPENPFANPASIVSSSPTVPPPCAQPAVGSRSSRDRSSYANTRHDRYPQYRIDTPCKSESMSSNEDTAIMTPMSSIDLEKASFAKEQAPKRPSRESKRSKGSKGSRKSRDPEKTSHGDRKDSHHPPGNSSVAYMDDEEDEEADEGRRIQQEHAVKILAFLAFPCVLVSAMNTVWAIIALVITALSQPIRICARRPSFGQQLAGLLGPTLNLQLRCIYTPLPPHANEDGSYHSFTLVLVHILSPFLSFVMMFASWVLAVYWISSTMVGDPAGQDKRDDGKETVLGLRRWWERWLMRGMKEE